MKLSELIYRSVKDTIYFDDTSFSLLEFKKGSFNGDPDYALNIFNAYASLNGAISRLNDLEKIQYRVVKVNSNLISQNGILDIEAFEQANNIKVKEIINIGFIANNEPIKLPHKMLGNDKALLSYMPNTTQYDIYLEFKEDIPYFDENSFYYQYDVNDEEVTENTIDVDLREYGIKDSFMPYIIEYIKGNLGSVVNEAIANMHLTRAEQYFNNIHSVTYTFSQKVVSPKYRIDD